MTGDRRSQHGQHTSAGPTGQLPHHRSDLGGQPDSSPLVPLQQPGELLPERPPVAPPVPAREPPHSHIQHHRPSIDGHISHGPLAPPMDMGGLDRALRAGHRHLPAAGPHPNQLALVRHIVDDQARQAREDYINKPVALDHPSA